MNKKEILKKTREYVKKKLSRESSGHDWRHIYRVWKNALHIGKNENVNMFVVQLAALLRDISDCKFNNNESSESKIAEKRHEFVEKFYHQTLEEYD